LVIVGSSCKDGNSRVSLNPGTFQWHGDRNTFKKSEYRNCEVEIRSFEIQRIDIESNPSIVQIPIPGSEFREEDHKEQKFSRKRRLSPQIQFGATGNRGQYRDEPWLILKPYTMLNIGDFYTIGKSIVHSELGQNSRGIQEKNQSHDSLNFDAWKI
jgi:hypothetical protein